MSNNVPTRPLIAIIAATLVLAFTAGCLGSGTGGTATPTVDQGTPGVPDTASGSAARLEIEVIYSGMWSGAWGTPREMQNDERFGNATLPLPQNPQSVKAMFQKQETTNETLTLRLLRDGVVIAEANGSEPLAVVTLEAVPSRL